jgi:outer membrane protein assembly factor BamB
MRKKYLVFAMIVAFPMHDVVAESRSGTSWSQWRGASRDGKVSASAKAWPESVSEKRLVKSWEVDLAEGYASPVVAGGKVFTVETRGKKTEIAQGFAVDSGDPVWKQEWSGAMKVPFFAAKNGSWVRATPATDGRFLVVPGMRDVLVNIDASTGEEIWRVDFVEREGTELPSFGFASSPLIDGDHVYVQAGMAVTKLDKKTGETVWRAMEDRRAMFASAFSSPLIATIHGKRQLVVQTRMSLAGLDLDTGKKLWSTPVEAFRGMNILTPTVVGNGIFTATYGGGCFYFEIEKGGEGFSARLAWRDKKIEGYMASPVAIGDHVYLHARNKKIYCIELKTGKVAWVTGEKFGDYWSMVANGNRVLALDQRGELVLFDASPQGFEELDRRKVSREPTWAHLAVDGEAVFVRGLKSLVAFQWK